MFKCHLYQSFATQQSEWLIILIIEKHRYKKGVLSLNIQMLSLKNSGAIVK